MIFVAQDVRQYNSCRLAFTRPLRCPQRRQLAPACSARNAAGSHRGTVDSVISISAVRCTGICHIWHYCQRRLRQTCDQFRLPENRPCGSPARITEEVMESGRYRTFVHRFVRPAHEQYQRCGNQPAYTGGQRRTVSTRHTQYAHQTTDHILFFDRRYAVRRNARAANNIFFSTSVQNLPVRFVWGFVFSKQCRDGFVIDINLRITLLFCGDAVSIIRRNFSQRSNARSSFSLRLPNPNAVYQLLSCSLMFR